MSALVKILWPFLFLVSVCAAEETSLLEQLTLDLEKDHSFGIVLSIHEHSDGIKDYRLGLIQGVTSIETSNLTASEYAYFKKGIENTLAQGTVISEEGPCGPKLRLRQVQASNHAVKCFRDEKNILDSTHDWVVLAREFVWMKKSQNNK